MKNQLKTTKLLTRKYNSSATLGVRSLSPITPMPFVSSMTPERRVRELCDSFYIRQLKGVVYPKGGLGNRQYMSSLTGKNVHSKTFVNTEFDSELNLFIDNVSSMVLNDDYKLVLRCWDTIIHSLYLSDPVDWDSIKEVLYDKFHLSGVSDFSEICDITLEIGPDQNGCKTANIMESYLPKSGESSQKRVGILSSVIKDLMVYKDNLGGYEETQEFIESLL